MQMIVGELVGQRESVSVENFVLLDGLIDVDGGPIRREKPVDSLAVVEVRDGYDI